MARDTETTTTYTIPTNYTNAGKIFGMFELRNMAEASVAALLTIYPIVVSSLSIQLKIFFSLALGLTLVFFVGSGIRGDSLTQFLGNIIKHLRHRRKLSYTPIISESKEVTEHAEKNKRRSGKSKDCKTPARKSGRSSKTKGK